MVDPMELESDLFATSFYKTEYQRENDTSLPKMELISVYNVFIERKFSHFWTQKIEKKSANPYQNSARELYNVCF